MKTKLTFLLSLAILCFPFYLYAQQVKVIDVGGQVLVKTDSSKQWEKAKANMTLNKGAELETKQDAYCTLAFDKKNKNIVTIKQNSRIKIDSIQPGNIYLPKGRVLALINKVSAKEKFQIRTPTAIAGARGTGWGTGYNGKSTSAQCFENTIFVQGLDEQGNVTEEEDVSEGMGTNVGRGGVVGESSPLGDSDYTEWSDFTGYANDLTGGGNQGNAGQDTGVGAGAPDDLRNDQRDDQRQNTGEQLRQDSGQGDSGGQGGGGMSKE